MGMGFKSISTLVLAAFLASNVGLAYETNTNGSKASQNSDNGQSSRSDKSQSQSQDSNQPSSNSKDASSTYVSLIGTGITTVALTVMLIVKISSPKSVDAAMNGDRDELDSVARSYQEAGFQVTGEQLEGAILETLAANDGLWDGTRVTQPEQFAELVMARITCPEAAHQL